MNQEQIQEKIIQLAQSKPYITSLDIEHLGSEGQLERARKTLRRAGKIETHGRIQIGNSTYAQITVPKKKIQISEQPKWPCGTPKSTGNAFDLSSPSKLVNPYKRSVAER